MTFNCNGSFETLIFVLSFQKKTKFDNQRFCPRNFHTSQFPFQFNWPTSVIEFVGKLKVISRERPVANRTRKISDSNHMIYCIKQSPFLVNLSLQFVCSGWKNLERYLRFVRLSTQKTLFCFSVQLILFLSRVRQISFSFRKKWSDIICASLFEVTIKNCDVIVEPPATAWQWISGSEIGGLLVTRIRLLFNFLHSFTEACYLLSKTVSHCFNLTSKLFRRGWNATWVLSLMLRHSDWSV